MLSKRRSSLIPFIAFVLLLVLMVWLGVWQLGRAEQKRNKSAQFDAQEQVMNVSNNPKTPLERYALVSVQGHFLSERQIIMDGFSRNKVAGYQVLSPFAVVDKELIVMVNRGWRPWVGRRQEVHDLGVDEQSRTITGRMDQFWQPGLVLGSGNSAEKNSWPRLSVYPQKEEISRWLEQEILPWQLLLDPQEPDGFVRDWQPSGLSPERHMGYAIQWFMMAFALVILAVVSIRSSDKRGTE